MWTPACTKMKNNLFIALIIFVIPNFILSCGNLENDLLESNLNGKVKSVRETSYKAIDRFGEIQKGDIIDDEILISNYYSLYNNKGNLIDLINYEIDGSIYNKTTITYDKNNRVSEIIWVYDDGNQDKWISKYDEHGYLIEDKSYNVDGSLYNKYLYINDNNGNLLSTSCYSADGTMRSKSFNKYDQKDNLTEHKEYNSLGQITFEQQYQYDKAGNMVEYIYKRSDYFKKSISSYDDKNNLIEEIDYSSEGKVKEKRTYSYKYDKKNNWTTKIFYRNDIPLYLIEREIAYYSITSLNTDAEQASTKKVKIDLPSDRIIESTVKELNKTTPEMVNEITRFDNALAMPNKTLQYNYTLITINKDDLEKDYFKNYMEPSIINGIRTSPDMKPLRDLGTTFVYHYRDKNGQFVHRFSITPEMYR